MKIFVVISNYINRVLIEPGNLVQLVLRD